MWRYTRQTSLVKLVLCKIISEAGIAAGVRRIEAVTGMAALDYVHQTENKINTAAGLLKGEAASLHW